MVTKTSEIALLLALISLVFAPSSSALNDAYVTIDSKGVGLCLAADTPDNVVCNSTEYLVLDGTRDHQLFLLPETDLKGNETALELINYSILTPVNLFLGIGGFLLVLSTAVMLTGALLRVAGVKIW